MRRQKLQRLVLLLATTAITVGTQAGIAGAKPANTSVSTQADLATTIASPSLTSVGSYLYYTITVTNNGPYSASNVVISDTTPSNPLASQPTTFYCVYSGRAWCGPLSSGLLCNTPNVGSTGTVKCTTASLSNRKSMTITIVVHVGFYLANQAVVDTATATSDTFDPNTANNTATISARVT